MKRRETAGGFHYYNLFQNCRWKFFLRYVMRIAPKRGESKLLFGIAIHAAVAAFLTGSDPTRIFEEVMDGQEEEYPDKESWTYDLNRGPILLGRWVNEVGEDLLRDFNVQAVEVEEQPALPNGYRLSLRADAVLSSRRNRGSGKPEVYILETKTTGWGRQLVEEALNNSDQVTTYIWGLSKCHPEWNVVGVIPNVMYQNQSKVGNGLGDLIFRTKKDLYQFEAQTMGILTEIASKVKAVEEGWDPIALFDRNCSWCTSYNKPCEYMSVCRHWDLKGIPEGFTRIEWDEREQLIEVSPHILRRYAHEKGSSGSRSSPAGGGSVLAGQLELDLADASGGCVERPDGIHREVPDPLHTDEGGHGG